jgi:hypothetical protein
MNETAYTLGQLAGLCLFGLSIYGWSLVLRRIIPTMPKLIACIGGAVFCALFLLATDSVGAWIAGQSATAIGMLAIAPDRSK